MSSFTRTAQIGRVTSPPPTPSAIQQWRRQIGCRARSAEERGPRPLVLVAYRLRGTVPHDLVPVERLTFVALFDELGADGRFSTWVLGCGGTAAADGVRIGERSRFAKNIRLPPNQGGRGPRFDAGSHDDLLEAALGWERHLERCGRHPYFPRRSTPRWPEWWCAVTDISSGLTTRRHQGRTLAMLEDVVRLEISFTDVLADLSTLPKRQVLVTDAPRRVLCGSDGLVSFDLYHNRFRPAT